MKHVFIADDGTQFGYEEECISYEMKKHEEEAAKAKAEKEKKEARDRRRKEIKDARDRYLDAYEKYKNLTKKYHDDYLENEDCDDDDTSYSFSDFLNALLNMT